MVMMSVNSTKMKQVRVTEGDGMSSKKGTSVMRDSEDPTEVDGSKMDVQDRESKSRDSQTGAEAAIDEEDDEQMRFVLSAERYLIGRDIRGICHLETERYGIVAWNDNRVYSVDREKPDAVIQFNMPHGERNSICMRLIPFYDCN